jgi:nucleoside-diphosphate-sugar epimerase
VKAPITSTAGFTLYGPLQRPDMGFHKVLRPTVLGEPMAIYRDRDQTRHFTFIADAVNAVMRAATRGIPGRVYNIGGGSRASRFAWRRPLVTVDPARKGDVRACTMRPPSDSKRVDRQSISG